MTDLEIRSNLYHKILENLQNRVKQEEFDGDFANAAKQKEKCQEELKHLYELLPLSEMTPEERDAQIKKLHEEIDNTPFSIGFYFNPDSYSDLETINYLKEKGLVDDFGAGQVTLASLKKLAMDLALENIEYNKLSDESKAYSLDTKPAIETKIEKIIELQEQRRSNQERYDMLRMYGEAKNSPVTPEDIAKKEEECKAIDDWKDSIQDEAKEVVLSIPDYEIPHKIQAYSYGLDNSGTGDIRNLPNQANYRTNKKLSRSFYMNRDYLFHDKFQDYTSWPLIQELFVNEFQPNIFISFADLLPGIADSVGEALGKVGNAFLGPAIKVGGKAIVDNMMKNISKNPSIMYVNKHDYERFTQDPVQTVRNMFMGGNWLNTFQLPYYGDKYLESNYSSKWDVGGIESQGAWGQGFGGLLKSVGIDYPGNPRFTVTMKDSANRSVVSTFYLINNGNIWLKKNFEFLHALFAGTSWVHLEKCVVRPANVYNVLCPSRFMFMWATMDVSITAVGKLRTCKEVSNEISSTAKSIDENTLWPDAWMVKVTLTELSPNNFNMYADYYMNGFVPDQIKQQAQEKSWGELVREIEKNVNFVINQISKNISSDSLQEAGQSANNIINNFTKNFK